jgi:hypothetical protein
MQGNDKILGNDGLGIKADGKAELFFVNAAGVEIAGPTKTDYIANEELELTPIRFLMVRYDPRYSFEVSTTMNMIIAWEGRVIEYPYTGVTQTAGTKTLEVYGPSAYPLKITINVLVYDFDTAPVITAGAELRNYGERLTASFSPTPADQLKNGPLETSSLDDLSLASSYTWQWYKDNKPYGAAVVGSDEGKILQHAAKKGTYKLSVKAKGFKEKFSNEISDLGTIFSSVENLAAYLDDDTWTNTAATPESVHLKIAGTAGPVGDDVLGAIEDGGKYINLDLSASSIYNTLSSRFFEGCGWLVGIDLGKNITSVEQRVFYMCNNLTTITVDPDNTGIELVNGSLYTRLLKELVYYMSKATADTLVIPADITTVLAYAVTFNDNIKFLDIRATDILINNNAFWNLPNLEKVTFYPVVANPNDNLVLRNAALTWFGDLQKKIVEGNGKGIYVRTNSNSGTSYVWKKESSL